MAYVIYTPVEAIARASNDAPESGAKLWFTLWNTNTPAGVFEDESGTTQSNPVLSLADGSWPEIFLDDTVRTRVRKYSPTATIPTDPYDWQVRDVLKVAAAAGMATDLSNSTASTNDMHNFLTDGGADAASIIYQPENVGSPARTVGGRLGDMVTPYDFGAAGNNLVDDSDAIEEFLNAITLRSNKMAIWAGKFRTTRHIPWDASGIEHLPNLHVNAKVFGDFTSEGAMFTLSNFVQGLTLTGKLWLEGTGGGDWSTRTVGHGLILDNVRHFNADVIQGFFFKYWAMKGLETCPTGNLKYGFFRQCGTFNVADNNSGKEISVTAVSDSGVAGSTSQRSVLTVNEVPAGIVALETPCYINGDPYLITAKGASTITVYPWVRRSQALPVACTLFMGGGLYIQGADTSAWKISTLETDVCGVGLADRALYPASVGVHLSQSCGVARTLGQLDSASVGGATKHSYYENNFIDILKVSSVNIGYSFVATTALDLAKARTLAPRNTDNSFDTALSYFNGIAVGKDGFVYTLQNSLRLGSASYSLTPGPDLAVPTVFLKQDAADITLTINPDLARLFNYTTIVVKAVGTGGGAPSGTYDFAASTGFTVNGGANDPFSGMTGPSEWMAYLQNTTTDWQLFHTAGF
jgi:hypothetical protein